MLTMVRPQRYNTEDVFLLEKLAQLEARESFWAYRRYVNPGMKIGWWQLEVASHLQKFYNDLMAGTRPKLILQAPPQHGKTKQITDFITWVAGKNPELKTIYTSYSSDLGVSANTNIQRILTDTQFLGTFPGTRLSSNETEGRWSRNTSFLEYVDHRGSFRNTTVEGQVTGKELDLGVVDDPIKGRSDSSSKHQRDKTWDWFTDDFFARFSDQAGLLVIMTRWHVDDVVGRMIERIPGVKHIRYAAIAERDERHRRKGEALFQEHKTLDFLLERRATLSQAGWESEYQQNPIVVGGGLFPIEKFEIIQSLPKIQKTVRYWDKAGTKDGGAFTAGVLIHQTTDKQYVVADVRRGQWTALDRERVIKQTAEIDRKAHPSTKIWVEQEPGSGGKESVEATIRMLAGFTCTADRVTGSKEIRAEPYAAQVQGGNVRLLAAEWNRAFLDEHETFPTGKYKDQVDATSGGFNKLASGPSYDTSLAWVGSGPQR